MRWIIHYGVNLGFMVALGSGAFCPPGRGWPHLACSPRTLSSVWLIGVISAPPQWFGFSPLVLFLLSPRFSFSFYEEVADLEHIGPSSRHLPEGASCPLWSLGPWCS